ncbi:ATP-binding protein [Chamaesiphon sp. OTE_75_metabat_556]|uniref:AAA family ATPase n=1 Tax=Chamaesiphon sp. OTE_75_metabat_556 TaxID=2964692 RepID=UPI00286CCAEC|nr:ATP-binding protein [Chamaesiphon sp. OTE_75_metabat_556]
MIEFSVGNYRSFKDVVTFSMVAAPIQHEDGEIDRNNVFTIPRDINLLKSAAIYGANASGKSNLVRAISFVRNFVLNSAVGRKVKDRIDTEIYKLSKDTENEPSYFEIIFEIGTTRYRYGFEVDRRSVKSEWLYQTLSTQESELFTREEKAIEVFDNFSEGKELNKKTRDNALFLSVVAQFNGEIATKIIDWFDRTLVVIFDLEDELEYEGMTDEIMDDDDRRQSLINLVRTLDLGIEDIRIVLTPFEDVDETFLHEVKTAHWRYDTDNNKLSIEQFDLNNEESAGTQKLYRLSGLLLNLLEDGGVLIVDELDSRLHPLITGAIVKLFNSPKTNPKNAQLIFTTHDTNLLSSNLFRKDQIWFTEKNRYGATDLYSLAEYKIPEQSSFEQDYIAGKYGAVPFIGDLSRLLGKK